MLVSLSLSLSLSLRYSDDQSKARGLGPGQGQHTSSPPLTARLPPFNDSKPEPGLGMVGQT